MTIEIGDEGSAPGSGFGRGKQTKSVIEHWGPGNTYLAVEG
jgi:hypothetical protein